MCPGWGLMTAEVTGTEVQLPRLFFWEELGRKEWGAEKYNCACSQEVKESRFEKQDTPPTSRSWR